GDPDISRERFGLIVPAVVPHAPHRISDICDVPEFPQRGQARGLGIGAAFNPFFDAQGHMTADFFVEFVQVRLHTRYSLLGSGFIMSPIACTSCDPRSASRASWAFPAAVSR